MHHFENVCKSSTPSASNKRAANRRVCLIDGEELLTLRKKDEKREYCHLNVNGRSVNFLLDCGATVKLLLLDDATAIDPTLIGLRPAATRLSMFDNTELKTIGMMTAEVQHPLSREQRRMEFYVAATHNRAILGMEACLDLEHLCCP